MSPVSIFTFSALLLIHLLLLPYICGASSVTKHYHSKCHLDVTVRNVSATAISLHWNPDHLSSHCKKYDRMKLVCRSGESNNYTDNVNHTTSTHHQGAKRVHYYPIIAGFGMMDNIESNTKYACTVYVSAIGGNRRIKIQHFEIHSSYGVPDSPERPVIKRDDNSITITLYNSTSHSGQLNGYEVQFHLSDNVPLDENNVPIISELSYRPLNENLPSLKDAQVSFSPTSFYFIRNTTKLPNHLVIDDSMMGGALKRNSSYVIVTTVYIMTENKKNLLYSHSPPSEILSFVSSSKHLSEWFKTAAVTTVPPTTLASFGERYGHRVLYLTICALPFGAILIFMGFCLVCRKYRAYRLKSDRNKMYGPIRVIRTDPSTSSLLPSPSQRYKARSSPQLSPYYTPSSSLCPRPHSMYETHSINKPSRSPSVRSLNSKPSCPLSSLYSTQQQQYNDSNNDEVVIVGLSDNHSLMLSQPNIVPPLQLESMDPSLVTASSSLTSVSSFSTPLSSIDDLLSLLPPHNQPVDISQYIPPQSADISPNTDPLYQYIPPLAVPEHSVPQIISSSDMSHSSAQSLSPLCQYKPLPMPPHSVSPIPPVSHTGSGQSLLSQYIPPPVTVSQPYPPCSTLLSSKYGLQHSISLPAESESFSSIISSSVGSPFDPIAQDIQPSLPPPLTPHHSSLITRKPPLLVLSSHDNQPGIPTVTTPLIQYNNKNMYSSHSSPSIIPPALNEEVEPHNNNSLMIPTVMVQSSHSVPPDSSSSSLLLYSDHLSLEDSGLMSEDHAPELELQFSELNLYPLNSPLIIPSLSSTYFLAPLIPSEYSSAYVTANTSMESLIATQGENNNKNNNNELNGNQSSEESQLYSTPPLSPSFYHKKPSNNCYYDYKDVLQLKEVHLQMEDEYSCMQQTKDTHSRHGRSNSEREKWTKNTNLTSIVNTSALKRVLTGASSSQENSVK